MCPLIALWSLCLLILGCVRAAPTKSKSSLVDRKTREAAQRQEMLEMDELLNR